RPAYRRRATFPRPSPLRRGIDLGAPATQRPTPRNGRLNQAIIHATLSLRGRLDTRRRSISRGRAARDSCELIVRSGSMPSLPRRVKRRQLILALAVGVGVVGAISVSAVVAAQRGLPDRYRYTG